MNPYEQLTAPLVHVKRQFTQNCLFMHAGAVFLSTPSLIAELRTHLKCDPTRDLIVMDVTSAPRIVKCDEVSYMLNTSVQRLNEATAQFELDKKKAEDQFQAKLTLSDIADETTE